MSASPLSYRAFGVPMERRSARRRLVAATYAMLAAVSAMTFWITLRGPAWTFSWALYAAVAVSIFVFGGQGRYGLVKAFVNKPPRPEPVIVDVVRLQLNPLSAATPDESAWRNDERELSLRDRAHYTAYQPLCLGFVILLVLSALALHPPRWASPQALLSGLLLLGIVGSVLSVTLPSAIILWAEPDMISDFADEGSR